MESSAARLFKIAFILTWGLIMTCAFFDLSRGFIDGVLYIVLVILLVCLREQRLGRSHVRFTRNPDLYANRCRGIGERIHHENYFEHLSELNSIKPMTFRKLRRAHSGDLKGE